MDTTIVEEIDLSDLSNFFILRRDADYHADRLKEARAALGLTQQEVSKRAGITLRQYQRFESGERDICSSSFRIGTSVCVVLNLDPTSFVYMIGGASHRPVVLPNSAIPNNQ